MADVLLARLAGVSYMLSGLAMHLEGAVAGFWCVESMAANACSLGNFNIWYSYSECCMVADIVLAGVADFSCHQHSCVATHLSGL